MLRGLVALGSWLSSSFRDARRRVGIGGVASHAALGIALTLSGCTDASATGETSSTGGEESSVRVSSEDYLAVSAGGEFTCGLLASGALRCWGEGLASVSPPTGSDFVEIRAGDSHACALRGGGSIECFGEDADGKLNAPTGAFVGLDVGSESACAWDSDGEVACWGRDSHGQVGQVSGPAEQVAVGSNHACILRPTGFIDCVGAQADSQTTAPAPPDDGAFVEVVAGERFSCARGSGDNVQCWGLDGFGQASPPVGLIACALGDAWSHVCALSSEGEGTCWGSNGFSQTSLPVGDSADGTAGDPPRFIALSAGRTHSCGVRVDAKVQCFGNDDQGQSSPP